MASPRQRAARWRLIQYAVLAILVAAILLLADWGEHKRAIFDPDIVREQFPDFIIIDT